VGGDLAVYKYEGPGHMNEGWECVYGWQDTMYNGCDTCTMAVRCVPGVGRVYGLRCVNDSRMHVGVAGGTRLDRRQGLKVLQQI